jgi:peptidyl-prolyl cis-trans isomerase C
MALYAVSLPLREDEEKNMLLRSRAASIGVAFWLATGVLTAQTPPPAPTPVVDPPPSKELIAARVNGQAVLEIAVYRGLMNVPPARREEARKDVLNFLIDNTIVDQYLIQLRIEVEHKEVQEQIEKIKDEAVKKKQVFADILKQLMINEDELRSELTSALRWDKFVIKQGTDKALRDMFDKNADMFNGTLTHARHILVLVKEGNKDDAVGKVASIKKSLEDEVAQALAQLPANAFAIAREKERARVLDKSFGEAALKYSDCPSKKEGGDLGFFPRAGKMVEPFARAAFALKPYQMSEPVATEFGYHLILAVDYKPGKEVTFEQVKPLVQEVYAERLREAILTHYKAKSRVERTK